MENIKINCPFCGQENTIDNSSAGLTASCINCKSMIEIPGQPKRNSRRVYSREFLAQESPFRRLPALLLLLFLGGFGAHRFYVHRFLSAVFMCIITLLALVTGGLSLLALTVWIIVDFVLVVVGNFKDGSGHIVSEWV